MLHGGLYTLGTRGVRGSERLNAACRFEESLNIHILWGSHNGPSKITRIETVTVRVTP